MLKGKVHLEDIKSIRKDIFNSTPYLVFMTITGVASIWGLVASLSVSSITIKIVVIFSLALLFLGFLYILTAKNKEIREIKDEYNSKILKIQNDCLCCKKLEVTTSFFHNFTHNIRNEIYGITKIWDSNNTNIESLNANLKSCSILVLNYLEKILTEIAGQQASVNIKVFEHKSVRKLSYKKWHVSTLCRSTNSDNDRNKFDNKSRTSVEYTEFDFILNGILNTFSVMNVKEFEEKVLYPQKLEYRNPNKAWKDYYNARIVSPIRLSGELIPKSFGISGTNSCHVMGFICVDFKDVILDLSTLNNCTKITQAFGDALYEYLEKYSYYRLALSK